MRILSLSLSLSILLGCLVGPVEARNRISKDDLPWYEIEVLIFANSEQKGLATETWPENDQPEGYEDIVNLIFSSKKHKVAAPDSATSGISYEIPEAYSIVRRSELRLRAISARINKSSSYHRLLHIAWRQPTEKPKQAIPVYVFSGMEDPKSARWIGDYNPNASNRFNGKPLPVNDRFGRPTQTSRATNSSGMIGPPAQPLYGTIRLGVSRYLHVETDLHFRAPVIQQEYVLEQPDSGFFSSSADPVQRLVERNVLLDFKLVESRRMRSKEIHFYDHPMFAMIVLVTPYDVVPD